MRTRTSAWWLTGKQHRDWLKLQFYKHGATCLRCVHEGKFYLTAHPYGGASWASSKTRRHEGLWQKQQGAMRFWSMYIYTFFVCGNTGWSCELWWMPKHEASALRTRTPKNEKKRERRSITWEWGPIILLGGGGWGWGEPWGPGGPCGIVQKEMEQGGRVCKKKCRRGAEKEARLLQGRRQSESKK